MSELTQDFEALLAYLNSSTGIDFRFYKRPSLTRRLEIRMQAVGTPSAADYLSYLQAHPKEIPALLDTLLINVSSFFRDAPSWKYLAEEAVPQMLASKPPDEPVRVWSAGCASGKEAYSLAVLFAELLGLEAFGQRVKIYATDLDQSEIEAGRRASYTEREAATLPPDLCAKYFERQGRRFQVSKDLRRAVIFARHNLLRDAPISRIDLLCCRNTLMYFNTSGQAEVLGRLHYAVNSGGLLFLGKSEMLAAYARLFQPLDLRRRVFIKVAEAGEHGRRFSPELFHKAVRLEPPPESRQLMMQDMVFDGGSLAQVLVDKAGTVTMINEQARLLFGMAAQDVGRPLQDLEFSYRPVEVRSLIDRAYAETRSVTVRDISWAYPPSGAALSLDVTVVPLLDTTGEAMGATITFTDTTPQKHAQDDLQNTIRELETAYEELQSTNEELETTYEELQSTIEELDTTNEELQSTNEELETINEELQFTNGEMSTVHNEVLQRGEELKGVNAFMLSILRSFRAGVAVLDQELLVQVWNPQMENLWGLRPEEAQGCHFWNLDIGLPVERLKQPLRAIVSGQGAHEVLLLEARNRKGRDIVCQVTCLPLLGEDNTCRGVILLMEQVPPADSAPPENLKSSL